MSKENEILYQSFEFARMTIRCYKHLVSMKEYILSKQLLKSGTSIGANVNEAQAAQSRNDFVSKMAIASKEARETKYWIRLLDSEGYLNDFLEKREMMEKIESIQRILTSIVKTSKENS